jgi:hypothetical protein
VSPPPAWIVIRTESALSCKQNVNNVKTARLEMTFFIKLLRSMFESRGNESSSNSHANQFRGELLLCAS